MTAVHAGRPLGDPIGTTGVELEWSVRGSFLAYVERLPDGTIEATDGARHTGRAFLLPGRSEPGGGFAFDGTLRFSGHFGLLDVELRELRIDRAIDGDGGGLSATVSGGRYAIARLDQLARDDDGMTRSDSVTFTDDGAAILGGVYSAGAEAAPVVIRPAIPGTRTH